MMIEILNDGRQCGVGFLFVRVNILTILDEADIDPRVARMNM